MIPLPTFFISIRSLQFPWLQPDETNLRRNEEGNENRHNITQVEQYIDLTPSITLAERVTGQHIYHKKLQSVRQTVPMDENNPVIQPP